MLALADQKARSAAQAAQELANTVHDTTEPAREMLARLRVMQSEEDNLRHALRIAQQQQQQKLAASLGGSLQQKLDRVLQEKELDVSELFSLLKQLADLGLGEKGLNTFVGYLNGTLQYALTEGDSNQTGIVGELTRVFEAVAVAVQDYAETVAQHMGSRLALDMIQQLQGRCDAIALRSFQAFISSARLRQREQQLEEDFISLSSGGSGGAVDVRDLDLPLADIAAVSQRAARYDSFVRAAAAKFYARLDETERAGVPEGGLPRHTTLNKLVLDLVSFAVLAERYYLFAAISKAARIDTYPAEAAEATESADEVLGSVSEPAVSTVVDDVFFIVGKSVRRALMSHNADNLCAALMNAADALERMLCAV